VVPNAEDDVTIAFGSGKIQHDAGSDTVNSLTTANPFSLAGGELIVATTLQADNILALSGGLLNVADTLTNNGTLTLVGTGSQTLSASIVNHGTINIDSNTNLTKSNATYTNEGTIQIAATATQSLSGNSPSFLQNSGTVTINVAFQQSGGAFHFSGGTITGTAVLSDAALDIAAGVISPATFAMRGNASTLSGNIAAGQAILVQGSADGPATLTAATEFTNSGTITLDSIDTARSATLIVTTGTLTNTATGVINANAGASGSRTFDADVTNNGSININADTAISKTNGVFTNNATVTNAANTTLGSQLTAAIFGGCHREPAELPLQ
jgi:hypothetical protein